MRGFSLKTVAIALLAVLNIYFITIYVVNIISHERELRVAENSVIHAFSSAGIEIGGTLPFREKAVSYTITASAYEEVKLAEALIGSSTLVSDAGSAADRFENAAGSAAFTSFGEYIVEFSSPEIGDVLELSREFIKKMGIAADEPVKKGEGGLSQVSARLIFNGIDIVNANVTFEFDGMGLRRISGALTEESKKASGRVYYDLPTLMVSFLGKCTRGEVECHRIDSVEPAFYRQAAGTGAELTYGYKIITDTGEWYLNAETGSIERVTV